MRDTCQASVERCNPLQYWSRSQQLADAAHVGQVRTRDSESVTGCTELSYCAQRERVLEERVARSCQLSRKQQLRFSGARLVLRCLNLTEEAMCSDQRTRLA